MTTIISGDTGISPVTASGTSASVDGMTVGRGGGEVSTNTAVGASALNANTSGSSNTAVGYQAGLNTNSADNVAVGYQAGYAGGPENVSVGSKAGFTSNTGYNVFVGRNAGNLSSGSGNCFVGWAAGTASTGSSNTFVGGNGLNTCGYAMTTGSKNTILGAFSGNNSGLDIRTASNAIVLSDGDGYPRFWVNGAAWTYGGSGGSAPATNTNTLQFTGDIFFYAGDAGSFNAANAVLKVQKVTSTGRSINTAGTINASGTDYAEYMIKCGNFTVAKGDVVGIDANGKLTNVFADAISFVVKSTDPSYVGGDTWGSKSQDKDGEQYTPEELEAQRQMVDRIAFSGQVPVNVTGATAGQYIIPVNDNGAIKGEAVSNPTFEQYQIAVGKVIAIESDGRAKIIVKVA